MTRSLQITERSKIAAFVWLILAIVLQASAQLFGKQAAVVSQGEGLTAIVLNHWYMLDITSLVGQAACWVMALRSFSLSFAYPFTSIVIGLNLLMAWAIYGETVTTNHILGIGVIMVSVVIVSRAHE